MGLEIATHTLSSRAWYTSGDKVTGTITWSTKHSAAVSRITVSLEGILETSIRPISGQESSWGTAKHVLLNRKQTLYPHGNSVSNCCSTFGPGAHTFDFLLAFPGESREEQLCRKCEPLLSNFLFTSDGIRASLQYRICVIVERRGILKPKLTKEHALEYRPHLPVFSSPSRQEWDTIGLANVLMPHVDTKAIPVIDQKTFKQSVVTMEVTLLGPRILRPGNPVSLSISFLVPSELRLSFTPMWIFGLSVRLKARTVATAATHIRAHVGYVDICVFQAAMPVEMRPGDSRITLPSALLERCIYPTAIPTFQFCPAERSYQLEVMVNFACSKAEATHKALSLIDVKMESGVMEESEPPPEYSWDAP